MDHASHGPTHAPKILGHADLLARRAAARREGRRVVHCHGCFDIVHPGHIRHLRQAKSLGDVLLVTVTGDGSISKGRGRPLIPEELRAENLAALDFVDWVYVEPRPTAVELLGEVQPDVYVKGREYESNNDPRFQAERDAVERAGGRIVFSSGDVVFSSTALIHAMEASVDPFHHRLTQLLESPGLAGPALFSTLSEMRNRRVVVVGETILDTYVLCDRPDVAGESPIMTLRPLEKRHYDGGAAIIARHAAALGARPIFVTSLDESEESEAFRRRMLAEGVEVRAIRVRTPRPEKQRFLVGAQKVMKLDLVEPYVLDEAQHDELVGVAVEAARSGGACDAAVVADFGLGLLTPATLRRLCLALRPHVGVMSGDVSGKRSSLASMRSMDLLCPSESEVRETFRLHAEGLPMVTWRLLEETGSKSAIVTMGPEGLIGFDRLPVVGESERRARKPGAEGLQPDAWLTRLKAEHVPALTPHAIDPLGCGDALLATATLALASGASLLGASFLGACAASCQAQRIGNIPVTAAELRQAIVRVHNAHLTYAAPDVISTPVRAALRAS